MAAAGGLKKIIVTGMGPGSPDYLLPAAREAIASSEVLVGGRRALADYASPEQQTFAITGDIEGVLAFIRQKLSEHDVCVLVSGDPGYYSLLDALRRTFPPEQLQVIPGISALQFAFARLALPWHDAKLLSFHGREPAERDLLYEQGALLGMLTDGQHTSRTIAACLLEHGWPRQAALYICQRLSYADEEILHTTLAEAAEQLGRAHGVLVAVG